MQHILDAIQAGASGLGMADAGGPRRSRGLPGGDAGNWIERNRRVVQRYQALVRSAVTLDALVDQEVNGSFQAHASNL